MRKVVFFMMTTLNGLYERGRWDVVPNALDWHNTDAEFETFAADQLGEADTILFGRVTYEGFAETWPTMSGDVADKINSLPKYVASTSLTETTWNAEVLVGDAVDAVAQLKDSGDGTLVKYGNGPFSRALFEAGLLDELHLSISPFVAGSGESLLSGIRTAAMDLTGVTEIGNGAVVLTYTPSR